MSDSDEDLAVFAAKADGIVNEQLNPKTRAGYEKKKRKLVAFLTAHFPESVDDDDEIILPLSEEITKTFGLCFDNNTTSEMRSCRRSRCPSALCSVHCHGISINAIVFIP